MKTKEVFFLLHESGEFFESSWKQNVFNVKDEFAAERFLSMQTAEKKKGHLHNGNEYTIVPGTITITVDKIEENE